MARKSSLAVPVASLALLLAASSALAVDHTVTVTDNPDERFLPQNLTIQVGDTVTWKNVAGTHNVVSDSAIFTSGDPASAPWTFSFGFAVEGSFKYHCALHQADGQIGTIVVRPARAANEIAVTINSWDMERTQPSVLGETLFDKFERHDGVFLSSVHLPSGVQLTGLEMSACDDSSVGGGASVVLFVCPEPNSPCDTIAFVDTVPSPTASACKVFTTNIPAGPIVDNLNNTYAIRVASNGGDGFRSVKVFYKKVLSPAPATATFGDVPTNHQFFRVIEALAASGITQGCGNGNFCPNDQVTRASMASFLARALGLYFPN